MCAQRVRLLVELLPVILITPFSSGEEGAHCSGSLSHQPSSHPMWEDILAQCCFYLSVMSCYRNSFHWFTDVVPNKVWHVVGWNVYQIHTWDVVCACVCVNGSMWLMCRWCVVNYVEHSPVSNPLKTWPTLRHSQFDAYFMPVSEALALKGDISGSGEHQYAGSQSITYVTHVRH